MKKKSASRTRAAVLIVSCLSLVVLNSGVPANHGGGGAATREPILLLADEDYPPLSYLEDGEARGLAVDLARALGPVLGRDVQVKAMNWAAAQQEVLRGRADGVLSMSATTRRATLYDFTESTVTHDFGLFIGSPGAAIAGLDDLAGRTVGVTAGGLPRAFLAAHSSARLELITNYEEGFARLTAGTLDAVAADRWVGAHILERDRTPGVISVGPPFARLSAGIAVRKGNAALATEIDEAVRALKANGTVMAIQRQWRSQEVVFLSRQRIGRLVTIGSVVLLMILAGGILLWVTTIRRQNRARRLLAHALHSANDCISITDTEDHILYVNEAFLRTYEYSERELLGHHIRMVRSAGDADATVGGILEATKRDGWRGTLLNRSKTGRVFPVALSTSMVHDGHGRIIAAVGVARDIGAEQAAATSKQVLEGQLRQAQKMESIGRLAGGIAHDFNNLLTVILGYAEELAGRLDPAGDAHADLEEIQRAARSASSLTRQLLIFSRKNIVQTTTVDLNEVVNRLDRMLKRVVGEHIEFIVRPAVVPLWVKADVSQIEQVVLNLVVNARDAMPTGGRLSIATDLADLDEAFVQAHPGVAPGTFARLTVTDTGMGMTPDVLAQIFTPFFTTKDATTGTGLGLATVHGIVQQSGGCITVESAPGRGASFVVSLPQVEAAVHGDEAPRGPVATGPSPATILFVEDDEGIRALGTRALRRLGYRVLTARHAADALQVAEAHTGSIDLLLTDIVMPGLHGPALAERLQLARGDVRVLYTSGYSDETLALRDVLAAGAALIQKPYSLDMLARAVRAVLAGSRPGDEGG